MNEEHMQILQVTIKKAYDLAFGKCFSFNDKENIKKTQKLVLMFNELSSDENDNFKHISTGYYPIIYNPKLMCLKLFNKGINPYITPEDLIEYLLTLDF
jgi:hypothetical protein